MNKKINKISIVDYKLSNLQSIKNSMHFLKYDVEITSDFKTIEKSDGIILPGVGSFPEAMKQMYKLDLINVIKDSVESKKLFLGICLGFQLLFNYSEEFKYTKGLEILEGHSSSFKEINNNLKTPNIGWYNLLINNKNLYKKKIALEDINKKMFFFVHSFYAIPKNEDVVFTYSENNNFKFCSSIYKDNIFGTQFHPEKSGKTGLNILKSFFT